MHAICLAGGGSVQRLWTIPRVFPPRSRSPRTRLGTLDLEPDSRRVAGRNLVSGSPHEGFRAAWAARVRTVRLFGNSTAHEIAHGLLAIADAGSLFCMHGRGNRSFGYSTSRD